MTSDEVWDLLGVIAVADKRTVGDADHKMWAALVGDLAFDDCQAAVIAHYRDSTEWIMAAHIRQRVVALRAERLRLAGNLEELIPEELASRPTEYVAALRELTEAVRDGQPAPKAIGGAS